MADTPPGAGKPAPDWERIEADYRAGILSVREIAAHHGISHTAINKRAKGSDTRLPWDRDLSAKIQARAEALVSKAEVSKQVSTEAATSERLIVEAGALRIAQVKSGHRVVGQRLGSLGMALLAELELQTANLEDLEKLGELMAAPDESGVDRMRDLFRKIIGTAGRVDSAKKVTEMLDRAVMLERLSYGIKADEGAGSGRPVVIIRDFTGKGDPDAPPQPE